MEFIRPMPTWEDFHQVPAARETFRKFRTPGEGERMILDGNAFVERVLPGAIKRKLSEEELAVYRAPFPTPQSRRPTWRLPNELPIAGEPADVYATLEAAHAALASSHYPKLLFAGDPGALVSPAFAERFAASLHNCELVHLGAGAHYPTGGSSRNVRLSRLSSRATPRGETSRMTQSCHRRHATRRMSAARPSTPLLR
jgi:haloalkane dehalogenase